MKNLVFTDDREADIKTIKKILEEHHKNDTRVFLSIFGPAGKIKGYITKIDDDTFCIGSNVEHHLIGYSDVFECVML